GLRGWVTPQSWVTVPEKMLSQCCLLKDLVRAIENDTAPVLSPEHARHVLEIMCKIPEALEKGVTVELETTF
ncbi:MAG: gfo/Idh/MocA family oxidoreductase, partial [Clostridia bacterium]|nr:gfo/Idh/MocA family oxidoreductase [Clostridia bacterium]